MRETGFITLSSECTLRNYIHMFKAKPEIQPEVNDQLAGEVKWRNGRKLLVWYLMKLG